MLTTKVSSLGNFLLFFLEEVFLSQQGCVTTQNSWYDQKGSHMNYLEFFDQKGHHLLLLTFLEKKEQRELFFLVPFIGFFP